jgi:uncharacterized protein (UPF0548 family)
MIRPDLAIEPTFADSLDRRAAFPTGRAWHTRRAIRRWRAHRRMVVTAPDRSPMAVIALAVGVNEAAVFSTSPCSHQSVPSFVTDLDRF